MSDSIPDGNTLSQKISHQVINWARVQNWKDGAGLPTVLQMSTHFKVNTRTVLAALEILRKQKKIYTVRGQGSFWGLHNMDLQESPRFRTGKISAKGQFSKELQLKIASGTYGYNTTLPTIREFCHQYNLGPHSIISLLRQLESQSVIYKKGRSWFVGTGKKELKRPSSLRISVLVQKQGDWSDLWKSTHFSRHYFTGLQAECDRMNIGIHVIHLKEIKEQKTLFTDKGNLGLIIPFSWELYSNLESVFQANLSPSQIIYPMLSSSHSYPQSQASRITILAPAQREGYKLLAKQIKSMGHQAGLFVTSQTAMEWELDRYTQLNEFFDNFGINFDLCKSNDLKNKTIYSNKTFIVAANDLIAGKFIGGFTKKNSVSPFILGMDNSLSGIENNLTTIDFGITSLGHLSVHLLLKDIKIKADSDGIFRPQPKLIFRGHLGKFPSNGWNKLRV